MFLYIHRNGFKNGQSGDGMDSLSSVHFKLQQTLNPRVTTKLPGGCAVPESFEESEGGQCEDIESTPEPGVIALLMVITLHSPFREKNYSKLIKTCVTSGEVG